jgi:hypothetical protein
MTPTDGSHNVALSAALLAYDEIARLRADVAEMERLKNEVATLAHERWKEIEAMKAVVTAARDVSREYRNGCRTSAAMRRLADALAALGKKEI